MSTNKLIWISGRMGFLRANEYFWVKSMTARGVRDLYEMLFWIFKRVRWSWRNRLIDRIRHECASEQRRLPKRPVIAKTSRHCHPRPRQEIHIRVIAAVQVAGMKTESACFRNSIIPYFDTYPCGAFRHLNCAPESILQQYRFCQMEFATLPVRFFLNKHR